MITYQEIKDWLKERDNKQKIIIGACFALVFIVGFGTGRFDRENSKANAKQQVHYNTTFQSKPPKNAAAAAPAAGEGQVAGTATGTPATGCVVKGNIGSTGKKTYHVAGGAFYATVKPEQCFATEAQAVAAGFVKSKR